MRSLSASVADEVVPVTSAAPANVTSIAPFVPAVVETLPSCASLSIRTSRLSSRSFGVSPTAVEFAICTLSASTWRPIEFTSSSVSVTLAAVWLWIVVSCEPSEWNPSVSAPAAWTSAWRVARFSGALATSCQAFQYFPSSELRPVSPGSASASSTCSRPSLFAS